MRGFVEVDSKYIKIGDTIKVDSIKFDNYLIESGELSFRETIKITDITILPDGSYYFIFGENRESLYIKPGKRIYKKISLKDIFLKL